MPRRILLIGLLGCVGCAGNGYVTQHSIDPDSAPQVAPGEISAPTIAVSPTAIRSRDVIPKESSSPPSVQPVAYRMPEKRSSDLRSPDVPGESPTDPAGDTIAETEVESSPSSPSVGTLTLNGQQYELKPVETDQSPTAGTPARFAGFQIDSNEPNVVRQVTPVAIPMWEEQLEEVIVPPSEALVESESLQMNLPSALAMIGGDHPAVGFAQWRVQEAYAQLDRSRVLWLPSIQAGFSFHKHDGNYQASDGRVVDVNRNSFQYGFGSGATGAGTTPRPGLVAQFHFADAIFLPRTMEKTAWARGHAAKAVVNTQMLRAAQAYTELLAAHQDASILAESLRRTNELLDITRNFADAGEGLQADADRMRTELALVENRLVLAQERKAIASARLAETLSIDHSLDITPLDVTAVPIDLVSMQMDKPSLVSNALVTRPELKESQALVAAACEAFQREKYAPLIPSVVLGFSTGGFGGGLGNELDDVDSRYDLDALMSWEIRNLGFGEKAARREASSRVQQAKFEKLQVMDTIAREVAEAYGLVQLRRQRVQTAEQGIQSALDSHQRNRERIKDGQGLPLEVLQSVQALEQARRNYLQAVVDHNQSQFQLQWAMGWPVTAPN